MSGSHMRGRVAGEEKSGRSQQRRGGIAREREGEAWASDYWRSHWLSAAVPFHLHWPKGAPPAATHRGARRPSTEQGVGPSSCMALQKGPGWVSGAEEHSGRQGRSAFSSWGQ